LGVSFAFLSATALAETFTVITAGDGAISTCILNDCITLRDALTAANQSAGADTINFNIPGDGVKTITPATPFPIITGPVTISGFSQPGTIKNTNDTLSGINAELLIELDGVLTKNHPVENGGLTIKAGNCLIEGLVIKNFEFSGILIDGGGDNKIEGNFIGTNADGVTAAANGSGIDILNSANNSIGDALNFSARNLISGNSFNGISIIGESSSGNKVEANLIGTDKTGNVALGNKAFGILLTSLVNVDSYPKDNMIGGVGPEFGNIISGNHDSGILMHRGVANTVAANYIGLNVDGDKKLPNGDLGVNRRAAGIFILEGSGHVIG